MAKAERKKRGKQSLPAYSVPMSDYVLTERQRKTMPLVSFFMRYLGVLVGIAAVIVIAVEGIPTYVTNGVHIDPSNIFVSDNAHLLSDETKEAIHAQNEDYRQLTKKPQLMVITVNKIPDDQSIETYTIDVASRLGVGDRDHDSGVVFLINKGTRQTRLEVGYGMEDQIPDAATEQVVDESVKDDFRSGHFDQGVRLVTKRLDKLIWTNSDDIDDDDMDENDDAQQDAVGFVALYIGMLILVFFMEVYSKEGREWVYWLQLDALIQHYIQDIQKINPKLPLAAIIDNGAEIIDAKLILREKLIASARTASGDIDKLKVPDYYDLTFAFGQINPEQFCDDKFRTDRRFKQSSMYLQHWCQWTVGKLWPERVFNQITGRAMAQAPVGTLPVKNKRAMEPWLLNPLQVLLYQLVCFFTVTWWWFILFWLVNRYFDLGSLLHFWQPGVLADHLSMIDAFFNNIGFLIVKKPLLFMAIAEMVVPISGFGSWLKEIRQFVLNHLRLNTLIRQFCQDLRSVLPELGDDHRLTAVLDSSAENTPAEVAKIKWQKMILTKQYQRRSKDNLLVKLRKHRIASKKQGDPAYEFRQSRQPRPDYMDMAFAYGATTNAEFLSADGSDEYYRLTSMYRNHEADWYYATIKASFSKAANSDSGTGFFGGGGSGGGDSFGGGSFGGGGGTSSY